MHAGHGTVGAKDFFGGTDCTTHGGPRLLFAGRSCKVVVYFAPLQRGPQTASLVVSDSSGGRPRTVALSGTGTEGYFIAGARGEVGNFGDAVFHGDATKLSLSAPIISLATTPNGAGYWLLGRDGGIFAFGDAHFYGSAGGVHLTSPAIQITPTPSGRGYWILTGDGHLYPYGDAQSYGTAIGQHTIGMAATPDGHGYWEVTRDGRTFNFGDAAPYGDIQRLGVNDVIGIAATAPPL